MSFVSSRVFSPSARALGDRDGEAEAECCIQLIVELRRYGKFSISTSCELAKAKISRMRHNFEMREYETNSDSLGRPRRM